MIKRFEVEPQLKCDINMDIQGLRKKKVAFRAKPNNRRWMHSWGSFERNGMLNVGLSRNFVRLMFPTVPLFLFAYSLQPAIHGTVYNQAYNNFQWETVYHKYGAKVRPFQCLVKVKQPMMRTINETINLRYGYLS